MCHRDTYQKCFKIWLITIATILVSSVIVYGLVVPQHTMEPRYSNGTHIFAPTVILISLDGTVNHDLDLHVTPVLSQMAQEGVKAKYMTPSFPPITFPNHWSLVTGLYPESHGIVGNYFYDVDLNDSFYYKSPDQSWDSKWWGGEPIWITAVKQNKKSGVIMWPGCSTVFEEDLRPTYSVAYSDYVTFDEKVDQVFDWFDLSLEDRPQFIGLYVPQIDQAGHAYGPYANETITQLKKADQSVGRLLKGLEIRNLTDIVNVIVVSDHGMSETSSSRLIFYEDFLSQEELELIWRVEGYPIFGIRIRPDHPAPEAAVDQLYKAFLRIQAHYPHIQVWKREQVPERLHFRHHVARIPPLIVLPDPGWNLVSHAEYDPRKGLDYQPKGVHGYDNLSPQSRAIFVARGPAFEQGQTIRPFWNIELYHLMARILYLTPTSNNNTLNGFLETM
ncbi:alkaline-phosphatase-like protein [Cokeromyces recurvatus]|uniref:alkaline-phosphatase-like protein n=1 Tax=Cokeromyces recurvatus TaxID=90255 RepID=UPI00222080BE|nr:alkaline-phosphatase-like protein [Cokeromyces recurvatus]KAI7903852.1 alkaline-phosphatase-like protein [Cokeromyces recurvatus]